MSTERIVIFADGSASPNPGPAAIGVVIKDEAGRVLGTLSAAIGRATNNEAEYRAVIEALRMAEKLGARQVELRSDSELLVKQLNGQYRVKAPGIRPLYIEVKRMQGKFVNCAFTLVPRELNEAHAYAEQRVLRP